MSDLPPGLSGYYSGAAEDASGLPTGASLAHALLDLLPLQRGPRPQFSEEEQPAGQEQKEAGKQKPEGSQLAFQLPPAPASVSARLRALLGRLLAAAGASGSSVADLAATTSGALTASASWSGSVDTLYTARSGSASDLQRHGSTASSLLSDELEGEREAASGEQYRWGDCTSSGFGCTPDPAWA